MRPKAPSPDATPGHEIQRFNTSKSMNTACPGRSRHCLRMRVLRRGSAGRRRVLDGQRRINAASRNIENDQLFRMVKGAIRRCSSDAPAS